MRYLLILGLLLHTNLSFSQKDDGISFFWLNNDLIQIYLDEEGDVTTKSKAVFYRSALIDNRSFTYSGKVTDYYMDNSKAYECNTMNGYLNGEVNCFYKNGRLKYHGFYYESLKDSVWTYYYENGKIEKIVKYSMDIPYIKEYYKINGSSVFMDGNGRYKGIIISGHKPFTEIKINGDIKNGKMDGTWQWNGPNSQGIDYFKNGEYVRGENYGRNDFPCPRMISLTGYDLHESSDIFKFYAFPREGPKSSDNIRLSGIPVAFNSSDIEATYLATDTTNQQLKYKSSIYLNKEFSDDFEDYLLKLCKNNEIRNFWCFIQFSVGENSKVENVFVHSNNYIISTSISQFISNIKDFKSVKIDNKPVGCEVYLSLFYEKGKMIIPEYNYNNLYVNLSNLIQGY